MEAYLDERFEPLTEIPEASDVTIRVLVNRGPASTGVDPATGWPCYR